MLMNCRSLPTMAKRMRGMCPLPSEVTRSSTETKILGKCQMSCSSQWRTLLWGLQRRLSIRNLATTRWSQLISSHLLQIPSIKSPTVEWTLKTIVKYKSATTRISRRLTRRSSGTEREHVNWNLAHIIRGVNLSKLIIIKPRSALRDLNLC